MNPQHEKIEENLARLARRVPDLGFESLAPHEQVALLVYSAHGVVTNGGFRQFYRGPIPLCTLVSALRALKLNALANVALTTAAQFPDPALADDPARRQAHLELLATEKQDFAFFRISSEELLNAIAKFWKVGKA